MQILKSLYDYYKKSRPHSQVVEIRHPALDHTEVYKKHTLTFNVCPFIVISTIKTDYDGDKYQDLVLYDSTGEAPLYQERNYNKRIAPKQWFNNVLRTIPEVKFRVSYLQANYLYNDEE